MGELTCLCLFLHSVLEQRAIMDYLLSNPEQSCWVLDGYDEFLNKLAKQDMKHMLDPESPLPVAEIISGLLHRQLLPGCTVLITCRLRDIMDLEDISDKVGQLLAWGCHEVKEYVDNFFRVKGKSLHLFKLHTDMSYCYLYRAKIM